MAKRILIFIGAVALLLVAVLGFSWWRGARALEAERAALRAEGVPLTIAEFEAWAASGPEASDADTAVLDFFFNGPVRYPVNRVSMIEGAALAELLEEDAASEDPWPTVYPDLRAHRAMLVEAMRIAAMPPVDVRLPMRRVLASHVNAAAAIQHVPASSIGLWLRELNRLIAVDAVAALKDGDAASAGRAFGAAFRVARHYESFGRSLLTQAVGRALYREAAEALLASISSQHWTPDALAHVAVSLPDVDHTAMRVAHLQGELSYMMILSALQRGSDTAVGMTANDGAQLLRFYREYIENLRLPYGEGREWIGAESEEMSRPGTAGYYIEFALAPSKTTLARSLVSQYVSQFETEAMLAITQAAVSIRAYELEHGHLPESLDTLPEAPPLDPYNGKPLHYRPDDDGAMLLYSAGPNYPEVATEQFRVVEFAVR